MSLEDQYDAWVRGLMGGGRYAATPKQAEDANDAVQQMQAQLDALTEAQKRQTAAGSALNAVQKAGAATAESVRRMSSELTKSLKQDGLLGGTVAAPSPAPAAPAKADFAGVTEKIKAQVLGQDVFVSALVKAFRRPFVLGTADDTAHARSVMLLCGPNGTGRHYALQCVVDELAARGAGAGCLCLGAGQGVPPPAACCTAPPWRRWIWRSTPAPRRRSCFCRTFTRRCSPTPRC